MFCEIIRADILLIAHIFPSLNEIWLVKYLCVLSRKKSCIYFFIIFIFLSFLHLYNKYRQHLKLRLTPQTISHRKNKQWKM